MLDVTLLGTAALFPLPDRALASVFLRCDGHSILFDCGEGTQTAARRCSVSLMKTDLIALTHYHGDHVFGLPGLLQTMHCMNRTLPLTIAGPAGLREALNPILRLAGETGYEVRLIELPADEDIPLLSILPGWPARARLCAFPTEHRVTSQGYRFELGRAGRFLPERALALGVPKPLWSALQNGESACVDGRAIAPDQVLGPERRGLSVVVSGDTCACPSLVRAARGADLLICEGTYASDDQADLAREHGHMNFAQAARVAAQAGARRLWLTHYSPRIEDPEAEMGSARKVFPDIVCGRDGMAIRLEFDD